MGAGPSSRGPNGSTAGVLRIQQELNTLMKEPVPFIFVNADEGDISKITALIVGPLETPYAGGFFHFDIRVVAEYPMKPPNVLLRTTDGGRVRFNPNLYSSGRVCLSILGTWDGPAWSSAESLASVLLSIQSLMCPKPYHNEPGYEKRNDTTQIAAYNDYIQYETLRTAVLGMMKRPTCVNVPAFEDILERQFLLWYDMYVRIGKDMEGRLEGSTYKDHFSSASGTFAVKNIVKELETVKTGILDKYSYAVSPIIRPAAVDNDGDGDLTMNGVNGHLGVSEHASNNASANSYAIDRLQDEYRAMKEQSAVSASPRNRETPFIWDATIMGPEGTPFEGGIYMLEIRCSSQHPYRPPFVKFTNKMFHPNITADGIPAVDILQSRWNSKTRLTTVVEELQNLLKNTSALYPVNHEAAELLRTNRKEYNRRVRRMAQEM